jgi:hypothetical protein
MIAKERGAGLVFTIHSHVIGEREELDSQHGHIIDPGWDSHLSVDHSHNKQGL